jgi:molybdopterin biosynthesis enzyme MoaB
MLTSLCLIPTGDEILDGTVSDTNSPAIMTLTLERFPACRVLRHQPVADDHDALSQALNNSLQGGYQLTICIGGSGGGKRFIPTLSTDLTPDTMLSFLDHSLTRDIYGNNGHLWARIVAGTKANNLFFNVPGPYAEAVAAVKSALPLFESTTTTPLEPLIDTVVKAIIAMYPPGAV